MKIIDAGQYVSLEGTDAGQLRCRITVRTDDGRQVSIPTSEETVNQIIQLMHGVVTSESVEAPSLPEEIPRNLFGGDTDVMTSAPSIGDISPEVPEQPQEPIPALGHTSRARTVGQDEYGYPIVQHQAEPPPDIADEEDPGEQI